MKEKVVKQRAHIYNIYYNDTPYTDEDHHEENIQVIK